MRNRDDNHCTVCLMVINKMRELSCGHKRAFNAYQHTMCDSGTHCCTQSIDRLLSPADKAFKRWCSCAPEAALQTKLPYRDKELTSVNRLTIAKQKLRMETM